MSSKTSGIERHYKVMEFDIKLYWVVKTCYYNQDVMKMKITLGEMATISVREFHLYLMMFQT